MKWYEHRDCGDRQGDNSKIQEITARAEPFIEDNSTTQ